MSRNEKNILIISCFGHFMSHFNMLMFPALVMPLTARFGMELTAVLALSFWMYLLFGLSALPWGLMTDGVGARPMMLGGVAYRGSSVILPSYFELRNQSLFDFLGHSGWLPASRNVAATLLASLVFLVGIFGQYLGGRAAERFEPRKMYFLFHALALPTALAVALTTDIPLFFFAMIYMFFMLGMQPIENTLVACLTPERLRHSGFGLKFIVTFGVGSVSIYLVGWIKGAWSLPAVFVALSGVSVAILIFIPLLMTVTRNMQIKG